jgi:hypothetical protein
MLTALFCLALDAWAQQAGAPPDTALVAKLLREPATPGVDRLARRDAIAAVLAERPAARAEGPAFSSRPPDMARFDALVDDATVPDCLHGDALKHQAPRIGVIEFSGLAAAPFLALAILRGKCR